MRLPVHKQMWWWGGAGIVLALALWRLGNVMTPFLLGAGIAYILDPIADRLERSGLKRKWAVGLITVTAVLAFAAVLLLIVPTLIRQITQAIEGLPAFLEKAQAILAAEFPRLIPEGGTLTVAMENAANAISEHGGQVLVTVLSSLGNVLGVMALIVIVPVVAFYLLLDWDGMVARVDELLPREHAPTLRHLGHEIDESLSGFLRGQGLVTLILGTFYAVSLFAVGLPFGLFIGIAAAILSIIPYVGVFIGGVTAIGVALVHFWGEPFWIGAVVAIFAFGQFVEGNYLQPRIIGGHVGLHPVWLMIALAVFGALFGFVGLVVAVPLAAIVGVVARFIAARYKESALYTGREVPPPPLQPTLIELVPRGTTALTLRKVALVADSARIEATGDIADISGPRGTLDIKAGALDLDQLLTFASDFAEGSGAASPGTAATSTPSTGAASADLTVSLSADRATMAGVSLEKVSGRAHLKGEDVTVEPLTFGLFGGTYNGTLRANLGAAPTFGWKAALANVDVAAMTAFVGNPGVISGRLGATVDVAGSGVDAATAMKTARGTAKLTITNGSVKNLALVRSAVAATSGNPQAVLAAAQGQPVDEPFTELGASMSIANGTASTPDLHFISKDIRLDAGGALKLDGSGVTLQGTVQLSQELSKQANPAIVRVAGQDGRITLPAIVRGNTSKYQIEIDTAALLKQAATNEVKARASEAVKKGIGGLLKR